MKVARVLNEAGITTFEALASANPTDLQQTPKAARLQRMDRTGRAGCKRRWGGFERLQGELNGGRKNKQNKGPDDWSSGLVLDYR